ncbi:MAG: DUF4173 domain-containing protein [Chloroflexi bacterium]|nr:DUF4173 domain-containing protein [Chloroflexota bacterium]
MTLRHPLRILLAGLALGILFDWLFYGKMLGISLTLFAGLLLVAVLMVARWEGAQVVRQNLWLVGLLMFFAVMVFVRANVFITFLNVCAMLLLLALIAVYLTRDFVANAGIGTYMVAPLRALVMSFNRGGHVVEYALVQGIEALPTTNRKNVMPFIRGCAIALPILLTFTALLYSADLIFADMLRQVISLEFLDQWWQWLWRALIIVVIGFTVMGGLAYTVWKQEQEQLSDPNPRQKSVSALGSTEALVVINAVNLLFLGFVFIQLPYLFGGQTNIASAEYTYADYARRGFAELVAVSLLTLALILGLHWQTKRSTQRERHLFNLSATGLILLTTILLISAFKRLLLYELAYGFTAMRIYPHVFMIWLGILLLWFVLTLWLRPNRFAVGLLACGFGFIITLNLMNPQAFAVRQNFARYQARTGASAVEATSAIESTRDHAIDAWYLIELSDDATPTLVDIVDGLEGDSYTIVDEHLEQRLRTMREDEHWRQWQSFHLARQRAFHSLSLRYGVETLTSEGS